MMGGGIRLFPVALEERSMQNAEPHPHPLSARFPFFWHKKQEILTG